MRASDQTAERDIRQIETKLICPNPRKRPAKHTRAEIRRAAAKMQKCFGAPLRVCPAPACELYMMLSDDVRLAAALSLGYKRVPCEIFDECVVSGAKISVSDPRYLLNSIESLVKTSVRAGIDAECVCSESVLSACAVVTVHKRRT